LFVQRLRRIVPADWWDECIKSFRATKPTSLRVNTLCAAVHETAAELAADGFALAPAGWLPEAFVAHLDAGERRRLTETHAVRQGRVYIQDLASMTAPLLLGPRPGETVLDLAAAPGGKTIHMAAMMENRGKLSAVESVRPRFFKLRSNLALYGATMVRTYLTDGRSVGRKTPERFDRVLLDAPCSGEARFDQRNPQTWQYWNVKKVKEAARKQKGLIRSALKTLKPGGRLLYCTCSFAPEENERIVHDLLVEKGDAVEVLPAELPLPNTQGGLTTWEGRAFDARLNMATRILPTEKMDGLFLCLLRKAETGPIDPSPRLTSRKRGRG
jgi:16S rRNA (cytosine1407-C5)-methyltransferase